MTVSRSAMLAVVLLGAPLSVGRAQNAAHPDKQQVVIISDPPGIRIAGGRERSMGKTPTQLKRTESNWEGIYSEMLIKAAANEPGQCTQIRVFRYDQLLPDTLFLDMHRCPDLSSDMSRIFSEDELQEAPQRISAPMPHYPEEERDRRQQGIAIIETVIDTLGRAEDANTRVLLYNQEVFAKEALRILPETIFSPGKVGDRKVRTRVHVPISFTTIN